MTLLSVSQPPSLLLVCLSLCVFVISIVQQQEWKSELNSSIRVRLLCLLFLSVVHEIPHELGNFAVFLQAGAPKCTALFLNLIGAASSVLAVRLSRVLPTAPFHCLSLSFSFVFLPSSLFPSCYCSFPVSCCQRNVERKRSKRVQ